MSAPHILLANIFFAPFTFGGATIVAEEVSRHLVATGAARISAVSLISRADLVPYSVTRAQTGGINNYLINVPQGRSYSVFYDNPEIERVVAELIDTLAPDLMHVHCIQEMGTGVLRAGHEAGVPIVLTVHDFWWICERQFMLRLDETYCAQSPVRIENCKGCVADWPAAKTRFSALGESACLAEIVTYPSRFALELCEASGLAPGKGVVWENGVHLPGPDFASAQAARRKRDPRPSFGFVGGPSQIKGWPLIRKAFKGVTDQNLRVCLVEGSRDGSWWPGHSFEDLPGTWQVYPRYAQNSMDSYYAEIDVLLFPSQWKETYGLTIREALARNICVIQTDSGGTTEHGAIAPEHLIPIGASPDILRAQINKVLRNGRDAIAPAQCQITGFLDQARNFMQLIAPILPAENLRIAT